MIRLLLPLKVTQSDSGIWLLDFFVGDAFDYTTPFRAILEKIALALELNPHDAIKLPIYEEYEDFVEGYLQLGNTQLGIYFEYSLGFLTLSNASQQIISEVRDRMQTVVES